MEECRPRLFEVAVGAPPRRLLVVDDFVAPEAVEPIFRHLRFRPYTLDDSDRPDTLDFNHFKHDFAIEPATADPLVVLLADRARALLGEQGIPSGPLYRIYANLNMFGDYQFAHRDGDGFTALLFANPKWDEDWGGEIIFYSQDASPVDHAIRPRPGRMVLFDGHIRHRGGVPSKFCHEPRITLAIKFQRG